MITKGKKRFESEATKKCYEDICELLEMDNENAVLFDGLEDALIGVGRRFGAEPVAVYDEAKIIDIFVKADGMNEQQAREHFDFNVAGLGVDHAPVVVNIYRDAFANAK